MRRLFSKILFALLAAACLAELSHACHGEEGLDGHSDCAACCCAARHVQQPEAEPKGDAPAAYLPSGPERAVLPPAPEDIFHPPVA